MTLKEKCMEMMEKYATTIEQGIELQNDLTEFANLVSDAQTEKIMKTLENMWSK